MLPNFISPSTYQVLIDEGVKDGNGNPIQMPVLNSRRRSLKDQLLIEAGRHQLYALRNRGINEIPVVVPEGLLLQAEMELGITDLNAAAGVRQVATSAGKAAAA